MANTGFSIAIAAACMMAAPAFAADAKLVWSDLDLTTAAGKAELDHRIDVAAQQVCAPEAVTGSRIAPTAPSASCLADAHAAIAEQFAARMDRSRLAARQAQGRAVTADARP
jgi:UrcA family protein